MKFQIIQKPTGCGWKIIFTALVDNAFEFCFNNDTFSPQLG